jgi:hypothetical protein
MKNNVYIILAVTSFLLISCWKLNEKAREREKKKEISGIILNKYNDSSYNGREAPILTVVNCIDTIEFNIFMWYTEYLWDYIDIGDSISKPSDTLLLTVFKPSGETKLYEYHETENNKIGIGFILFIVLGILSLSYKMFIKNRKI